MFSLVQLTETLINKSGHACGRAGGQNKEGEPPLHQLFCLIILLSGYVFLALAATDLLLARIMPAYLQAGPNPFGMLLFFISSSIFMLIARRMSLARIRTYLITGIALFFPLVFLSSVIVLLTAEPGARPLVYKTVHCAGPDRDTICGAGFSLMVFSMAARALPAVLTAPLIYAVTLSWLRGRTRTT